MKQPRYNLWHNQDLQLENATWHQLEDCMAENCWHKDDVDIEEIEEEQNG